MRADRLKHNHWAPALVVRLAVRDLAHEWILTLCLVLAVASVLAPLLVLLGLKHGTVQTLRERLVQDPVYREIRPAATRLYAPSWFEAWSARQRVAFLVPTILPGSAIIQARAADGAWRNLDLVPTAPGDVLLEENGAAIPRSGEVVLSDAAARRLGLRSGDPVLLRVTRNRAGRREHGELTANVVSVLEPRATSLERLYAPLALALDAEAYKEGSAIAARGWAGGARHPAPAFDGVAILLPEPLGPVERSGLAVNTGLTEILPMREAAFRELFGFAAPPGHTVYRGTAGRGSVPLNGIQALRHNKLRGRAALLLPYVRALDVELNCTGGGAAPMQQALALFGLSLGPEVADRLGLAPTPWGRFNPQREQAGLRQILPPDSGRLDRSDCLLRYRDGLEFPVRVVGEAAGERALAPLELAATLRAADARSVRYDSEHNGFVLARAGFRGFRMYARSIDDVVALQRALAAEGIEVIARSREISRIRTLDRGLTRIFWLIAAIGAIGGVAVLVASLYAAVERKRRELCVVRLLGMSRAMVFRFPVYQGLMMVSLGSATAAATYVLLARIINAAFAGELAPGGAIVALPPVYPATAVAIAGAAALLSSLAAGWRATAMDPAEGVRDE